MKFILFTWCLFATTALAQSGGTPVPPGIQRLLDEVRCRQCTCAVPTGQTLCKNITLGWVEPDGTEVPYTTNTSAKTAFNMCHFRYSEPAPGGRRNCAALNGNPCSGVGFVGRASAPGGHGDYQNRPGWIPLTTGRLTCDNAAPRKGVIAEYQGAGKAARLRPLSGVERQGAIPLEQSTAMNDEVHGQDY